jgi:hypothetical protein
MLFKNVFSRSKLPLFNKTMNKRFIASFKKYHNEFILKYFFSEENADKSIISYLQSFNIKNACNLIDVA